MHQYKSAGDTLFRLLFVLTSSNFITIFLHSNESYQYRERKCLAAPLFLLFSFMVGVFFIVFPYMVYRSAELLLHIFSLFFFCIATVNLLQSLCFFEIMLLNYCSTGVTDLYPTLMHQAELYPILIQ